MQCFVDNIGAWETSSTTPEPLWYAFKILIFIAETASRQKCRHGLLLTKRNREA
jgi:hypothetical protein